MRFFSCRTIDVLKPAHGCFTIAVGLMMLTCLSATAQEELVITADDLVRPVGAYDVYTAASPDGKVFGDLKVVIEECMTFGNTRIAKTHGWLNGNTVSEMWRVITPDRVSFYLSGDSRSVHDSYPLPLEVGKTCTYKTGNVTNVVRVTGEETITTPAGTFRCLVSIVEEDGVPTKRTWSAPGLGAVQFHGLKPEPHTLVLKETKNPKAVALPPGWDLLTNYEPGADPSETLFPDAKLTSFGNGVTEPKFDTSEGAHGTCGSLRWSYYVEPGDWVQGGVLLTGSLDKTFDLSRYDAISFYVKGFRPGTCGLIINGAPDPMHPKPWTILPLQYTSEWQKVTFNLADHDFSPMDVRKVQSMSLSHLGSEEAKGDVVWMDELTAHRKKAE